MPCQSGLRISSHHGSTHSSRPSAASSGAAVCRARTSGEQSTSSKCSRRRYSRHHLRLAVPERGERRVVHVQPVEHPLRLAVADQHDLHLRPTLPTLATVAASVSPAVDLDPLRSPASAGWFPDPLRRFEFRYFNGERWTDDVSADGTRFVDPGPFTPPREPAPTAARPSTATRRARSPSCRSCSAIAGVALVVGARSSSSSAASARSPRSSSASSRCAGRTRSPPRRAPVDGRRLRARLRDRRALPRARSASACASSG